MTREEEIKKFAHDYSEENYKGDGYEAYAEKEDIAKACVDSIKWADQHPRKGLWDSEKVISFIKENIREYHKSGVFHVDNFINDLRKAMEGE